MKSLSGSPINHLEQGLRPRASSYRMTTQSTSRRSSTMSLPVELETPETTEDEISTPPIRPLSQELDLSRMPSLSDIDLVCSETSNDLDLLLTCDSNHTTSVSNHSTDPPNESIPLFEHFLVIGASVDVSITPPSAPLLPSSSCSSCRLFSASLRLQSISLIKLLTNKLVLREEDYGAL
jgi:hypothetical protein